MSLKKIILAGLCSFVSSVSFAQFAIVNDKDGYVNIRSTNNVTGDLIAKLNNGTLIYLYDNEGNWTNMEFRHSSSNDSIRSGYIYKDRYTPIENFEFIPTYKFGMNEVTLKKDDIAITITTKDFDVKKHVLKYDKKQANILLTIDNQKIWGADGNIPKKEIEKIVVTINNKAFPLPKQAYSNLYEFNIADVKAYIDTTNNLLYIYSVNSDGAGGYASLLVIQDGKYKERFVTNGF